LSQSILTAKFGTLEIISENTVY